MANINLTIDMILRRSLRVLHQKCNFIDNIVRDFDDSFAQSGAKIGDTLRIRLPIQYATGTGPTIATGTGADSLGASTYFDSTLRYYRWSEGDTEWFLFPVDGYFDWADHGCAGTTGSDSGNIV